jgi:hypothetical protein
MKTLAPFVISSTLIERATSGHYSQVSHLKGLDLRRDCVGGSDRHVVPHVWSFPHGEYHLRHRKR